MNGHNNMEEIVGDYKGACVCWGRDVWTVNNNDCAIYDPAQNGVASNSNITGYAG